MTTAGSPSPGIRLSAPAYFACVAFVSALGIGVAMVFRPAFAHSIRATLGLEKTPQATAESFYTARVAPVFEEHCVGCHGAHRQKADLRLDSFAAAMRGGKHGPIILAGNLKGSELMARLLLPADDDEAMPPGGRPPLSAAEVTVIRLWIAAGASGALPVAAIKGAPPPVRKIEFPQIDAAAIARARAPLAQIVEELRTRLPGALTYESRGSADLHLNAALLGRAFGDAEVAALAPIRERIVWADLSGTAISDASAPALAEFTRLRTLRVANTDIADPTARTLTALESLTSLTVTGTAVTASGLAALRRRGVKIHDGHAKASNAI